MREAADVIVVGAGPAGLACAIALRRRGLEPIVVEAADAPGGRVRTDEVEGFLLDRGFQVVNTSYPALRRYAPVRRLALHRIPPAAVVAGEGGMHLVGNPLFAPSSIGGSVRSRLLGVRDAVALGRAMLPLLRSNRAALSGGDCSAADYLAAAGVSPKFIDGFLRPFFGGVFLETSLATSAKVLRYDLRQFAVAPTGLPERGMRAIPELMTATLGRGRVRCGAAVVRLLEDQAGIPRGVGLADGGELRGRAVVVATDAPSAARLTGLPVPATMNGEVCTWVACDRSVLPGGHLLLDPRPDAAYSNAIEASATVPAYAPSGHHLIGLVAPGVIGSGGGAAGDPRAGWDDRQWATAAVDALHGWFPRLRVARVLRVQRIPNGLLRQPPGIHPALVGWAEPRPGLLMAGEHTLAASLNAAMLSGERAARRAAVLAGAGTGERVADPAQPIAGT